MMGEWLGEKREGEWMDILRGREGWVREMMGEGPCGGGGVGMRKVWGWWWWGLFRWWVGMRG